jgi:hypothetical protein
MEITDPIDRPFSYNGSMHCASDHPHRHVVDALACVAPGDGYVEDIALVLLVLPAGQVEPNVRPEYLAEALVSAAAAEDVVAPKTRPMALLNRQALDVHLLLWYYAHPANLIHIKYKFNNFGLVGFSTKDSLFSLFFYWFSIIIIVCIFPIKKTTTENQRIRDCMV